MYTRIAPTPSGYLHTGNICSFLLTRKLANQHDGSILLRIDDLDSDRVRPEYLCNIFETLHRFSITYEEGPKDIADFTTHFSQHTRLPFYEQLLNELCDTGLVYSCDCSRKRLIENGNCTCREKRIPLETPETTWRVQVPGKTSIWLHDERLGMHRINLATVMPDFIVRKKDGLPAYQIASLADDLQYGIDYIVRGEDLLPSTAAQLYLATITGKDSFLKNRFYHHPLLTDSAGRKLSKSAGTIPARMLENTVAMRKAVETLINGW